MSSLKVKHIRGLLLLTLAAYLFLPPGLRVIVENTGQELIVETTVTVAGSPFRFGPIKPESFASGTFLPLWFSDLQINYDVFQGKSKRVTADVSIWPLDRGELHVAIENGKLSIVSDGRGIKRRW